MKSFWLVPNQEVRESRTSGSSTQTQKFETIVVANSYKNAPSLRLRIFRNWPKANLVPRAHVPLPAVGKGTWALGTRLAKGQTPFSSP